MNPSGGKSGELSEWADPVRKWPAGACFAGYVLRMDTTYYSIAESPVGSLTLRWSGGALVGVGFGDASKRAQHGKWVRDDAQLSAVRAQLDEYFRGERSSFELPLAYAGTALQERVWRALALIPFGQTTSYGELAERIGEPKWPGARDVGAALNQNPIAVVLPCHRVIGADGSLVGFGGGLSRKHWLLAHEGRTDTQPIAAQTSLPWLEVSSSNRNSP